MLPLGLGIELEEVDPSGTQKHCGQKIIIIPQST